LGGGLPPYQVASTDWPKIGGCAPLGVAGYPSNNVAWADVYLN